jgi:hypothetical protein
MILRLSFSKIKDNGIYYLSEDAFRNEIKWKKVAVYIDLIKSLHKNNKLRLMRLFT